MARVVRSAAAALSLQANKRQAGLSFTGTTAMAYEVATVLVRRTATTESSTVMEALQ